MIQMITSLLFVLTTAVPAEEPAPLVGAVAFDAMMPLAPGEVEGAFVLEMHRGGASKTEMTTIPSAHLGLGIAGPVSAEFILPFVLQHHESGTVGDLGDVALVVKCSLLRTESFGLALGGDMKVPTGDEEHGMGSGHLHLGLALGWAWLASEHFSLQGNAGFASALGAEERAMFGGVSASLALPLGMRAFVETVGEFNPDSSELALSVGPGFAASLFGEVNLSLSALAGTTETAEPLRAMFKVAHTF